MKQNFLAIVWIAYDGLVDYGVKAYYRIRHCKNEFAKGRNHIKWQKLFCFVTLTTASRMGYAKHRLIKFKGIKKDNFCFI